MINFAEMSLVLQALPDPAFILSRSGKYVAVFGGRDTRYYHDGGGLVGYYITDLIKSAKADWFLKKIGEALETGRLIIEEYELSNKDVVGLPDEGPDEPIWFEGRVQSLNFTIDNEEVVLWVASNITERHRLEVQLRELSDTDQLTGLYNRRKLDDQLQAHYENFTRYQLPLSVVSFDLDDLKPLNDSLGHGAGDMALRRVADICREQLRMNDIACRMGGDEFVILLPNTEHFQAQKFADRFKDSCNTALCQLNDQSFSLSVSIGVATCIGTDRDPYDVIRRADIALYEAKKAGKNCIVAG